MLVVCTYNDAGKKPAELLEYKEQIGHAFKIENDPRITKVGKFIRKYSIDELPQLFNILNWYIKEEKQ